MISGVAATATLAQAQKARLAIFFDHEQSALEAFIENDAVPRSA